ncbi:MAG: hypothetical protein ABSA21_03525 [Candidatus Limnocylindrales bacterium]|jgi:hypothetical protein
MTTSVEQLATHRRLSARLQASWPEFAAKRQQRLVQADRLGRAAEKVAENIIEDLFTGPLDWSRSDVKYQVECASDFDGGTVQAREAAATRQRS